MIKHRPRLFLYSICLKLVIGKLYSYWKDPTQKRQITKYAMLVPPPYHTQVPCRSPSRHSYKDFFFLRFISFYFIVWMFCLCVCMCTIYMQCPQRPKDGVRAPRTGGVSLHVGAQGGQQVLLKLSYLSSLDISSLFSALRW